MLYINFDYVLYFKFILCNCFFLLLRLFLFMSESFFKEKCKEALKPYEVAWQRCKICNHVTKKKYQNPRLMFLEVLLWISLQLFVSINSVTPAFNHVTHVLHQNLLVHRYTSNKSHNISFFYVSSVNFKLWSTNSIKQEKCKRPYKKRGHLRT